MSSEVEIEALTFENLKSSDIADLNEILLHSKNSTIFHTFEWSKIVAEEFGANEKILIARVNDIPVGMYKFHCYKEYKLLKSCTSPVTGFETVYGGPIAVNHYDYVIEDLIKKSEKLVGWPVKISIQSPINYDIHPFVKMGYECVALYTSVLELGKSEKALWIGLNKKTRNLVRKAMKNGIDIVEGDASSVPDYYDMILSTFDRAGIGALPKTFYERVIKDLKPKNMVKMLLAEYKDKVVSGAIFLCYKDMAYYWHGASYKEYWDLAPNNLMQWEFIKWANENGYTYYDLVRIEPDRLPGIAKFKMGWGGDTVEFYYIFKFKLIKPLNLLLTNKLKKKRECKINVKK